MKCPHCEYEDRQKSSEYSYWEGEHGDFFQSPIKLNRSDSRFYANETKALYGCPACNKTFIGE